MEEADGHAAFIAKGLGDIARAKGMAQVDSAASNTDTLGMATRELQATASSFRHASTQLELEVHGILHQLRVTRIEAEARLAKRLNEEDGGGDAQ